MNWYGFYNGKGFMLEEYMNGGVFQPKLNLSIKFVPKVILSTCAMTH